MVIYFQFLNIKIFLKTGMEEKMDTPKYAKGNVLYEGKTKKIFTVYLDGSLVPDLLIVENKDDITAFDDPKFTKKFSTKARCATETTCRVFELLRASGLPVAFVEQRSETEFLAPRCTMIPLEVVVRRYAVGSYLKRHPEFEKEGKPHRFGDLVVEFFLKTTKGGLKDTDGNVLIEGLDPTKGEEDPLILNPRDAAWELFHSKKPDSNPDARLGTVHARPVINDPEYIDRMYGIARNVFLALEVSWALQGYRFIDLKIEYGVDAKGNLLVADVIDNDSWRLKTNDWEELSKEAFRQGEELGEVERKYELVSELVGKLRVPV